MNSGASGEKAKSVKSDSNPLNNQTVVNQATQNMMFVDINSNNHSSKSFEYYF